MTIDELVKKLQNFEPDLEVIVCFDDYETDKMEGNYHLLPIRVRQLSTGQITIDTEPEDC